MASKAADKVSILSRLGALVPLPAWLAAAKDEKKSGAFAAQSPTSHSSCGTTVSESSVPSSAACGQLS